MSKKVKFTPEKKEFLVLKYRELNVSLSKFCRMYAVERTAIHRWSIKYDAEVKEIKMKTYYSSYTLLNSVEEYLSNKISMLQKNGVSEYQVRDWARKYSKVGETALEDKRGTRKDLQNLSPEEALRRENKELQDKNRRLEAEILLIKKLQLLGRDVK